MKTKREVLKRIIEYGNCKGIVCIDCPYYEYHKHCPNKDLKRIGAMAILRTFPEKKKPILKVGTKIKFDDGKIAEVRLNEVGYQLCFIDGRYTTIDYLVDKTWEVVE